MAESLIDSLNLADLEYLEDMGIELQALAALSADNLPKASWITHLAFVIRRKADPTLAIADVRLTPLAELTDVLGLIGGDDESDPE